MVEEVSLVCSNYLSYLQVMLMLEKQKHLDCQSFPYLQPDFSNESLALTMHLRGLLCRLDQSMIVVAEFGPLSALFWVS